jgi:hypothetical protein
MLDLSFVAHKKLSGNFLALHFMLWHTVTSYLIRILNRICILYLCPESGIITEHRISNLESRISNPGISTAKKGDTFHFCEKQLVFRVYSRFTSTFFTETEERKFENMSSARNHKFDSISVPSSAI